MFEFTQLGSVYVERYGDMHVLVSSNSLTDNSTFIIEMVVIVQFGAVIVWASAKLFEMWADQDIPHPGSQILQILLQWTSRT